MRFMRFTYKTAIFDHESQQEQQELLIVGPRALTHTRGQKVLKRPLLWNEK